MASVVAELRRQPCNTDISALSDRALALEPRPAGALGPARRPQRPRRPADWVAGCVLVYMTLFGVGKVIFGEPLLGLVFLALAAAAGFVIYWDLNRRGWSTVVE